MTYRKDNNCIRHTRPWQRRQTAYRCEPLLRSGVRDLWQPWRPEKLSDKQIDAGRDAALHVLAGRQILVLGVEIWRALWRRVGPDRALAEVVCGQLAA